MSGTSVNLSLVLNKNEASRLNPSSSKQINEFLKDADSDSFKKSGDLILLSYQASSAIRKILKANPHWDNPPKNLYTALKNERGALKKRWTEGGGERLTDPVGENKVIFDKMKAVDQKIKEYKCALEKTHPQSAKLARQWDCDKISEIKKRLSAAVQLQREYYDTTWIGAFAKLFLKLVGEWNNGDTAAIQAALRTLYAWDFEQPLYPAKHKCFLLGTPYLTGTNEYAKGCSFASRDSEEMGDLPGDIPWLRTSWIKKHLKTDHLYNEPMSKQVTIVNAPDVKAYCLP